MLGPPLMLSLMALDLGSGALRPPRRRSPPAPLHAALAGGCGEVPVAMPAAKRLHRGAVPGPEHAVLHVAERRLQIVVALARRQRAVPEDVGVVPEVGAGQAAHRDSFLFGAVTRDGVDLVAPGVEVLDVHLLDLRTLPAGEKGLDVAPGLAHGDDLHHDPGLGAGPRLALEE